MAEVTRRSILKLASTLPFLGWLSVRADDVFKVRVDIRYIQFGIAGAQVRFPDYGFQWNYAGVHVSGIERAFKIQTSKVIEFVEWVDWPEPSGPHPYWPTIHSGTIRVRPA